jgi:hypothetical protein
MKVCDKTCIFFFFPIINKYFLMAKRSLLSRCPSYILGVTIKIIQFLNYMYSLLINRHLLKIICMSVDSLVRTVRHLEFGFIQIDVTLFIKRTNVLCYL